MKIRSVWTFLALVTATVVVLLVFIQSTYFADVLKSVVRRYMPPGIAVDIGFTELSVKILPPGVVIKNPVITFKKGNPAGIPAGTHLEARALDVTFQFFQLLTGAVTVNAFMIDGASLSLNIDRSFLSGHEKRLQVRHSARRLSWDSLVHFNFRSVGLIDSRIDVRLAADTGMPGRIRATAKELTVGKSTVEKAPAYNLSVDLRDVNLAFANFAHPLSQMQCSVEVSSRGVAVRNLALQEGESNVHINGQIKGNILERSSLRSSLSVVARGHLEEWFKPNLLGRILKIPVNKIRGSFSMEGKIQADLMDLRRTLDAKTTVMFDEVVFGEWSFVKGLAKGWVKSTEIGIESAEFDLGNGDGSVRLSHTTYDTALNDQRMKAKVEFENANLRRIVAPELKSIYPLHMFLNGAVETDILASKDFEIDGKADLKVRRFSLDNQSMAVKKPLKVLLAIPEVKLKSAFHIDQTGVEIERAEAILPRSQLSAKGRVDGGGYDLDITGTMNAADVGKIGPFDIIGDGRLHWTIKGPTKEVVFGFDIDLNSAEYLNLKLGTTKGLILYNDGNNTLTFRNFQARQGRTELTANGVIDLGDRETVDLSVQVPVGAVQDFANLFSYFLKRSVPWYPWDLSGSVNGLIRVTGKTDMDLLSAEGDMEFHNVDFHRELFRHGRGHVGYRRGAYLAEKVSIQKKSGFIRGNLVHGADNILKYDFHSEALSTLDIDHFASLGIAYRAPLVFESHGEGKIGQLKSQFQLFVGQGLLKNYPIAATQLKFTTDRGNINGSLSMFGGGLLGSVALLSDVRDRSVVDVEAKNFDFKPVVMALNPDLADDSELETEATGAIHLSFPMNAISRLSGMARMDSFVVRKRDYFLQLAKSVFVEAKDGAYEFDDVRFIGEGSQLVGRGRVVNGQMNSTLTGFLNLGFMEFVAKEIASVRGPVKIDAKFFGAADSPHFEATGKASDIDLRLRSVEQPFENLGFDVSWKDADVAVSNVKAKFAGGTVTGGGTARIYPYKVPDLDFKLDLDNPKAKVYPMAYVRTSGRGALKGSELPYKVSGNLTVAEALIRENFSLSEGARSLRSSKFLPQKGTGTGDLQLFDLDINVTADSGVFVKNDLFDCELKGNLKIINTIQAPRLLGTASTIHGRLIFKDNYFQIQGANIRFTNPAALDPEFDFIGQTETKGYKITVVANGAVSDYRINFQSQPPLSQNDIVNLLTFGITSSEYQNVARENRAGYTRDEMYNLLFSQSGINRGLQEKLGVRLRVDQSQVITPENAFRPRNSADAPETVAPKVVLEKQIMKNLNASVGSTVGVGDNQEHNAGLEYGVTKDVSVIGIYEDQRGAQVKQSRTSVGADIKVKLRFK